MLRFLLIGCLLSCALLHGQSVLSRAGGRFSFQETYSSSDTTVVAGALPYWHPYAFSSGGGYVGAMNRYGLSALTECMFGGASVNSDRVLRWSGLLSGDGYFQQAVFQFGLIRELSDRFRIGTGIGLSYAGVSGYGGRWVPVGSVVLGGLFGSRMVWGIAWDNPHQMIIGKGMLSSSPMRVRVGVSQVLSRQLSLYGGMEWEPGIANGTLLRLAYRPSADWRVELGNGWRPDQILLGLHRRVRRGWVGLCFSQEFTLGGSFFFGYSWNGFKKQRR